MSCIILFKENLPPSELKKLKNKQRKKALKEEVQKQQKADEHKKENVLQQKENKKAEKDGELDGPKEVELMPEKLVKVKSVVVIANLLKCVAAVANLLKCVAVIANLLKYCFLCFLATVFILFANVVVNCCIID